MLLMGFGELRRELPVAPLFRQTKEEPFYSLSMADAQGDDLAESLQSLFTNISSMVKSELQGTNNQMDLLEKMNVRVAAEYDDLGDVAAGLRVFAEQMKLKSGGFDEFVGQMDAIEKQVSEFEAVVSVLDRSQSVSSEIDKPRICIGYVNDKTSPHPCSVVCIIT